MTFPANTENRYISIEMLIYGLYGTDGVTGEWIKLHNEELNDLYSPPNIVRVIKSRRMRWACHVARMGKRRRIQGFGGET